MSKGRDIFQLGSVNLTTVNRGSKKLRRYDSNSPAKLTLLSFRSPAFSTTSMILKWSASFILFHLKCCKTARSHAERVWWRCAMTFPTLTTTTSSLCPAAASILHWATIAGWDEISDSWQQGCCLTRAHIRTESHNWRQAIVSKTTSNPVKGSHDESDDLMKRPDNGNTSFGQDAIMFAADTEAQQLTDVADVAAWSASPTLSSDLGICGRHLAPAEEADGISHPAVLPFWIYVKYQPEYLQTLEYILLIKSYCAAGKVDVLPRADEAKPIRGFEPCEHHILKSLSVYGEKMWTRVITTPASLKSTDLTPPWYALIFNMIWTTQQV